MTLARDPREEATLHRSISALSAIGLPIFATDGGSRPEFVARLADVAQVTVSGDVARGLVGQVRTSLRAAADLGAAFVLYTEPDKQWFFEHRLPSFLADAPLDADVGVVIAGRSPEGFASFPPVQQIAEEPLNRLCGRLLGQEGDYFYGPFLMHRDLVPWLDQVPDDLGWGWRPFVFAIAHRLGRRVVHVTDDFQCPVDQRDEDAGEQLHRVRQLAENARGLLAGMTCDTLQSD